MNIDELILGKYRLLEYLNSGTFSSVFRAREEMTNRIVAIKALTKEAYPPGRMRYLLDEFQSMAKISGHPNIVAIHTVEPGKDNYLAWIVMEYVEGKSLHQLLQDGPLGLTDTLNIGLDICRGLETAHAQNIMHRDIKPQNILLTTDKQAKIADFSIARIFSNTTEIAKTMTGTRRYMAPEQHYGAYDYRADLYATALILYQAATGRYPFSGGNEEIDKKKAYGEIEELDRCPEILRSFLQKGLHRQLPQRYRSAKEMYDELDRIRIAEYTKQASQLIDASSNTAVIGLKDALERYRKTFRFSLEAAEQINQNLFFERRRKVEQNKREKLITQLNQHYTQALRYVQCQNYPGALTELQKANRLCIDEPNLIKTVDNLFHQLKNPSVSFSEIPTVEEIVALIRKLPDKESVLLRTWLDNQEPDTEEPIEIGSIQPRLEVTRSYRLLIEEASPEFLLEQVHADLQYPHEQKASHIYRQAQIYEQQERLRRSHAQYKKLGAFYQKQASNFIKADDLELAANCYTRARFAYTVAQKNWAARKNARNGGYYYMRLARQLELKRVWIESGKAYILSAYNYGYAQLTAKAEECYRKAAVCYFNAAESAHLNGDLQAAYDFYKLILAIGEKLPAPTQVILETEKLISEIHVQDQKEPKR